MKSPKKDNLEALRLAIGQQIKPPAPEAPSAAVKHSTERPAAKKPRAAVNRKAASASSLPARSGRGVQFYLDDGDRKLISHLAVWFGSQDRRVSDSQVVKAAIRLASAQQNSRLLEICDSVRATDRRRQTRREVEKEEK
jgi:hypothetical protein